MSEPPEIRRSPRIRTWFETHFSSQRQEGEGVLADVSYTGARVEDTRIQPSIGALAILYVCLPDDPKPFQLEGRVARHTEAGFAIEYERPDEATRRGVDRIGALVGIPEEAPGDSSEAIPIETAGDDIPATEPESLEMTHPNELDLGEYEIPELEMLADRIADELARRRAETRRRVRGEIEKLAEREGFSLAEVLGARAEDGE